MVALGVVGGLRLGEVVQAAQVVELQRKRPLASARAPAAPLGAVKRTHVRAADALQQQPGDLRLPVELRLGDAQLLLRLREEAQRSERSGAGAPPPLLTGRLTLSTSSLSSWRSSRVRGGKDRKVQIQRSSQHNQPVSTDSRRHSHTLKARNLGGPVGPL